jgi:hypothetical protein
LSGGTLILLQLLLAPVVLVALSWLILRFGSWKWLLLVASVGIAAGAIGLSRYVDRPTLPPIACAMPERVGELGALCGVERPEDFALVASQNLIIVSEERSGGRLMGLRPDRLEAEPLTLWPAALATDDSTTDGIGDPDCDAPNTATFAPQGLSVLDRSASGGSIRVAVVAHGGRETVQFFDLTSDESPALRWRGCIFYPPHTTGNGIAFRRDGSLLATNFLPEGAGEEGARHRLRGGLGFDTGDVLLWTATGGWTHIPDTAGAMPNGIVVARTESEEFYFADAGNWSVAIVEPVGGSWRVERVRVGGAPDNLTLTEDGRVLATVVTFGGDKPVLCGIGGRQCRLGWAIWEVDPRTRSAELVFEHDGSAIGSATTAFTLGPYLLIGTMIDDRVGVYRRR